MSLSSPASCVACTGECICHGMSACIYMKASLGRQQRLSCLSGWGWASTAALSTRTRRMLRFIT